MFKFNFKMTSFIRANIPGIGVPGGDTSLNTDELIVAINEYSPYAFYIAKDDDTAGEFTDYSGSDRHGVQATVADQPTVNYTRVNERPAHQFNTDDVYTGHVDVRGLAGDDHTVYAVARSRDGDGSGFQSFFLGRVGSNARWFAENSNNTGESTANISENWDNISLPQDPEGNAQVVMLKRDGDVGKLRKKTTRLDENVTATRTGYPSIDSLTYGADKLDYVALVFFDTAHDETTENEIMTLLSDYVLSVVEDTVAASSPIFSNGASIPFSPAFSAPTAIYNSTNQKTVFTYVTSDDNINLTISVNEYDHSSGNLGTENNAILSYTWAVGNYHGIPAIARDHQGYYHVVGGAHNTRFFYASSTNPNDISAFTTRSNIEGNYTYPKLTFVGGTGYLFARGLYTDYDFYLRKTSALASGVATWAAHQELLTFGSNTRAYAGDFAVDESNGLIYIPLTKSNLADTVRDDLFMIVYDTTDDTIRNVEDTVSYGSGSWPISAADMDTHFRVVNMGSESSGGVPSVVLISGEPAIAYAQGSDPNNLLNIKYIEWSGSAWSTPVNVGQNYGTRYANFTMTKDNSGAVKVLYGERYNYKGDYQPKLTTRNSDGSWTHPKVVLERDSRAMMMARVENGNNDMLALFTEYVGAGSGDVSGDNKAFAYGTSGILNISAAAPDAIDDLSVTIGDTDAALSWSAPNANYSDITDYIVQYSTDNTNWTTFADGTSTATTTTVTGLTNDTLYYFRVSAVNGEGTGAASNVVSGTPVAPTVIEALNPLAWYSVESTDDFTLVGSGVSQLDDKSGNNRHITQATASRQPTYNAAGKYLQFDGSNHFLGNTDPFMYNNGEIEVHLVFENEAGNDRRYLSENSTGNTGPFYAFQNKNDDSDIMAVLFRDNSSSTFLANSIALSTDNALDGTLQIAGWRDTGSLVTAMLEGVDETSNAQSYTRPTSISFNTFTLGAVVRSTISGHAAMKFREIVITNVLTSTERANLIAELKTKWSIA